MKGSWGIKRFCHGWMKVALLLAANRAWCGNCLFFPKHERNEIIKLITSCLMGVHALNDTSSLLQM